MQSWIEYNDENMNLKILPYYFAFNDMDNTVYDLSQLKGMYICQQPRPRCEDTTEYLIVIYVGVNHKEIEIYYKDEESRNKDYISILEILTGKKLVTKENE